MYSLSVVSPKIAVVKPRFNIRPYPHREGHYKLFLNNTFIIFCRQIILIINFYQENRRICKKKHTKSWWNIQKSSSYSSFLLFYSENKNFVLEVGTIYKIKVIFMIFLYGKLHYFVAACRALMNKLLIGWAWKWPFAASTRRQIKIDISRCKMLI